MPVNMWQDERMNDNGDGAAVIGTVEQLKALADPTRQAILEVLMTTRDHDLPVMSVKELAAALGEPQTKLYRHVKQLESAGLIRVAASRMVSGILEQRYQASQRDLTLRPGFLYEHVEETETAAQAVFERFRTAFLPHFAAELRAADGKPIPDEERRTALILGYGRLSPARAAEVRSRRREVLACFDEPDSDDPDAEEMTLLAGYYGPASGNEPD
jgi:DNA-binding transcriptional ArsR family regulator